MRNKKAKAYRKLIGDVSADYNEQEFHYINYGTTNPKFAQITNTITLTTACGRAKYKTLKMVDS